MKKYLLLLSIALLFFPPQKISAQLVVANAVGISPHVLVEQVLIGTGVTVSNVKFNNSTSNITVNAIGEFTNGNTTNIGLDSGLLLTSGLASIAIGPNTGNGSGNNNGLPGDPQLAALIPGYTVNDASVLEFDFVPESDTIKFRWVFGSDEYPEYVNSSFNDVFGFFVSVGPNPVTWIPYNNKNIALIPSPPAPANTPVTIDNVNIGSYPQYYVNNMGGTTIEYDGFTTVLTAWCRVIPCLTYHIKIAVADAGDFIYDSGVFLEGGSFSSGGITTTASYQAPNGSTTAFVNGIEGCNDAVISFVFTEPVVDSLVINIASIGGTAINGVDYTWIPNSVIVPAGHDSVAVVIHPLIDNITEGTEIVTLVVPTGLCSFITGEYDTLSVYIEDYVPPYVIALGDTTVNCGDTAFLHVYDTGGYAPLNYEWRVDSLGVSPLPNVGVAPVQTTTYTIHVTDICNITATDSVEVIVVGPFADAGEDTSICIGQNVQLTAWGGINYYWSTGDSIQSLNVSPTITTTYYVTVEDVCIDIDSVTVFVNPLPVLNISASADSICPGDQVQFNASGADFWQWTANPGDASLAGQNTLAGPLVSPLQTTLYHLTGTDLNGCSDDMTYNIYVKPTPTSDFSIFDTLICDGELTTILYTGTATINAHYIWDFDGATAIGSGQGPYQISWATEGNYTVSLYIDDDDCMSPVTEKMVIVQPHPIVSFTADNTEGCPPLLVQFNDNSQNALPGASWYWEFGDGGYSAGSNPGHTYNQSGIFDVKLTVTNQNGCQGSSIITDIVEVYPVPIASFEHHPDLVSEFNPLVKFYDRSLGNISAWEWDLGDGTFSFEPNPHRMYEDTGLFNIILVVTNNFGCTDTAFSDILVRPDYTIYIPNAFTPDGDLINDVFLVKGINLQTFEMSIFNRWGEMIFLSKDINIGWDGNYKGQIAPSGIYSYVIKFIDVNGMVQSRYGHVTLVR